MLSDKKLYRAITMCISGLLLMIISGYFFVQHYIFYVERIPAFYAVSGLISALLIIAISNLLKKFGLKKKENYYD